MLGIITTLDLVFIQRNVLTSFKTNLSTNQMTVTLLHKFPFCCRVKSGFPPNLLCCIVLIFSFTLIRWSHFRPIGHFHQFSLWIIILEPLTWNTPPTRLTCEVKSTCCAKNGYLLLQNLDFVDTRSNIKTLTCWIIALLSAFLTSASIPSVVPNTNCHSLQARSDLKTFQRASDSRGTKKFCVPAAAFCWSRFTIIFSNCLQVLERSRRLQSVFW